MRKQKNFYLTFFIQQIENIERSDGNTLSLAAEPYMNSLKPNRQPSNKIKQPFLVQNSR